MNRCLALRIEHANTIMTRLFELIEVYREERKNKNPRVVDIDIDGVKTVITESFKREQTFAAGTSTVKTIEVDRSVTFDEAVDEVERAKTTGGDQMGIFIQKTYSDKSRVCPVVLATLVKGKGKVIIVRPNGVKTSVGKEEFEHGYEKRSEMLQLRNLWTKYYDKALEKGTHKKRTFVLTFPILDYICQRSPDCVSMVRIVSPDESVLGMKVSEGEARRLQTLALQRADEAGEA